LVNYSYFSCSFQVLRFYVYASTVTVKLKKVSYRKLITFHIKIKEFTLSSTNVSLNIVIRDNVQHTVHFCGSRELTAFCVAQNPDYFLLLYPLKWDKSFHPKPCIVPTISFFFAEIICTTVMSINLIM
jgi:hypothetical protein